MTYVTFYCSIFISASNEPSGRVSVHLANAARVKYPAALLRCKFDTPSACCGMFDLCDITIHKDKVANTACHNEKVKNFV